VGEGIFNYEKYLGFDPVRRIIFTLPVRRVDEKTIEETEEYKLISNSTEKRLVCM